VPIEKKVFEAIMPAFATRDLVELCKFAAMQSGCGSAREMRNPAEPRLHPCMPPVLGVEARDHD
jgi:hypothetical protein